MLLVKRMGLIKWASWLVHLQPLEKTTTILEDFHGCDVNT